ncbi:MAG: DNA repair protein RecN [Thermoflexaceae bacterium]|nr:DNA repair protein RecN [Thermoflexaceae bacterium]
MLVNLHVKNLALIEEADINFENGLNILTGETGAGKSILIGSINVALGGKVNGDFIRKGAEYGLCELTFKVHSDARIKALKALDVMELEEGVVIISRKILPNRTILKVNGENRTINEVKQIASFLIDIHGQHEHQSLLYKNNYIGIIDRYLGKDAIPVREALKKEYSQYLSLKKQLGEYSMDMEQLNRQMAYLEYEIKEIEDAGLKDGEDTELEALFKKYNNSRKIMENIQDTHDLLSEREESVSSLISRAYKNVSAAMEYDDGLNNIFAQIRDIEDLINGLAFDVSEYMSDMEYDEEQYAYVEERLSFINKLKQKYGNTVLEINRYLSGQQEKLDSLKNYDEIKNRLTKELEASQNTVLSLCEELSGKRKAAAKLLSKDIEKALRELNFLDVRFEIQVTKTEVFSDNGYDEMDFLISTNPGEDLKPLSKVASGGELSRIILAIKTVLADKDDIEALIFDEIDTGISGRTAQMVSVKLNEISRTHQVLCITHLPQIAAMADEHFLIEKNVNNGSTVTTIQELSMEESVGELARLLGGVSITENVMNNAREMKDLALRSKTTNMI